MSGLGKSIGAQLSELKETLDFNEDESGVVKKFTSLNRKVKINNTDVLYSFEDLVYKIPINILRTRVIELNKIIMALEPGINSDVAFIHTNSEGVLIEFTWTEIKEFIIEAIKSKQDLPAYKKILNQYKKAQQNNDVKNIILLGKKL